MTLKPSSQCQIQFYRPHILLSVKMSVIVMRLWFTVVCEIYTEYLMYGFGLHTFENSREYEHFCGNYNGMPGRINLDLVSQYI